MRKDGHVLKDCQEKKISTTQESSKLEFGTWLKFQGFGKQAKNPNFEPNNEKDESTQPNVKEVPEEGIQIEVNEPLDINQMENILPDQVVLDSSR